MRTRYPSIPVVTPRQSVRGKTDRVVVVGAGLSGLVVAVLLAASGRSVTVVERQGHVGGRAATETISTFLGNVRVDTGATVVTMPWLIDEVLASVGMSVNDIAPYFVYRRLDPAYHAIFSSGRHFNVFADNGESGGKSQQSDGEVRRFVSDKYSCPEQPLGRVADGQLTDALVNDVRRYRAWAQSMFEASFSHLMSADFDSPLDLIRTQESARSLVRVLRLRGLGSLGSAVQRYIRDDELRRVFSFQALYAGVPPRKARAVYSTISHMDTGLGVFYPTLGPHGSGVGALCDILAAALQRAGGTIMLGTRASALHHTANRIDTVVTDQGVLHADVVVATCDIPELNLLSGRPNRRRLRWSPSAFVMHGAVPREVARQWPGGHHTMSFGQAWDQTFTEITAPRGRGRLMSDPSLLITRPACSAPDRVSVGSSQVEIEPVSILAPCPNLESAPIDWELLSPHYQEDLLTVADNRGFSGIKDYFAIGRVDTPADWADLGMGAGTPFSPAHLFRQTGPFRPRNFPLRQFSNLIYAGSSTTPGVGVPTVILSGALAAARVTRGDRR